MNKRRFAAVWQRRLAWSALVWCVGLYVSQVEAQARRRGAAAASVPASSDTVANEGGATPPGYDRAVENALHEFTLENYAEARSGFREAHRLYPNARTFRALGMVEFELKNYATAVEYLEQALASQERRLSDAQRGDAEQLLARARSYIGRYRVTLRPPHASLMVDGSQAAIDANGLLVLPVGKHVIEAEAEGHRSLHRELQVVGGEEEPLDLLLMAVPVARKEDSAPDAPATSTPVYKKWWLWTTLGVVVAAGAATGVILALRKSEPGEATGGNTSTVLRLPPEMNSLRF